MQEPPNPPEPPSPPNLTGRTALWRSVKLARPSLSDQQVDDLLHETFLQERQLMLDGLTQDRAREIVNQDLFPPTLDPWAGDEAYGPKR